MKTRNFLRTTGAAIVAVLALTAAPVLGQGAPLGGTITLSLTPSTTTPATNSNFTVDLGIDLTAATGTCTGPTTVPMTLGGYILGITYDNTLLQFVSAASCGAAQFTNPLCTASTTVVDCNDSNTGFTNQPQGNVCVARLTFKNLAASGTTPASLVTLHTGGSRSIASNLIIGCGGPVNFPSASITDGTVPSITPVSLMDFSAR
jgi:hypothetical protein